MPLELTLAPDRDRGGHVYTAAPVSAAEVRELSDWLADAALNPDVTFVVDAAGARGARARLELRALIRRHSGLLAGRRLSLVEQPARPSRAAIGALLAH